MSLKGFFYRLTRIPVDVARNIIYKQKVKALSKEAFQKGLGTDHAYRQYIDHQIGKSYRLSEHAAMKGNPVIDRTRHLVELFAKVASPRPGDNILCVGCRGVAELNFLKDKYGLEAIGLDLFSSDPRITAGDMHKMPFADNTFQNLYSCHSLEHAYDIDVALREFVRVVKNKGTITIEVPIHFVPNKTDYWDVGSAESLIGRLQSGAEVLYSENGKNAGNSEKNVARIVVRISK